MMDAFGRLNILSEERFMRVSRIIFSILRRDKSFSINNCVIFLEETLQTIGNISRAISVSNCITNYPTPRTHLLAVCSQHEALFSLRGNEKKPHGDSKRHSKCWDSKLRAKSKGTRDALPRDATSPASTSFARFYLDASQAHKADSNLIEGP